MVMVHSIQKICTQIKNTPYKFTAINHVTIVVEHIRIKFTINNCSYAPPIIINNMYAEADFIY